MMPPAVVARKTSSAVSSFARGMSAVSAGMPSSPQSLEHGLLRDAAQAAMARRINDAVVDDENVETGAFGDQTLSIAEHGGVEPVVMGFPQRALEIAPHVILHGGIEAGIVHAGMDEIQIWAPRSCTSGVMTSIQGRA